MQVFLGVGGDTVQWPRTKGTAGNERVHSFVDFCLIFYPQPVPLYPLSLMSLQYAIC